MLDSVFVAPGRVLAAPDEEIVQHDPRSEAADVGPPADASRGVRLRERQRAAEHLADGPGFGALRGFRSGQRFWTGSIPLFLIAAAARSEARNAISRLDASTSFEPATIAAANVWMS